MTANILHRISRLFQPMNIIPKTANNVERNLLVDTGIIKQISPGMYALMPLGLKSLQKLINIVDEEMTNIGAQKIQLPALSSTKLWEKSKRLALAQNELFYVKSRNDSYILSPTHEEMITEMISQVTKNKSDFPLLLYQITNKWRDELKPRLGLFRGCEFMMKDLYSFDLNHENAQKTYDLVGEAYDRIFKRIGIPFTKAVGDTGIMGGSISHEYHYFHTMGEDKVLLCSSCNYAMNKQISNGECPVCQNQMIENDGVEVGHTFLLNTKYSKIFNATHIIDNKHVPLIMGSYGLGLTRILGASIEILSSPFAVRWPASLAPYSVCIIGPKGGSKEEYVSHYINDIYNILTQSKIDTIVDDRSNLTIGKRVIFAKTTGYPYVIVVGKSATETRPIFEVLDVYYEKSHNFSFEELIDYFNKNCLDKRFMAC